jgi:hypothetical protein
VEESLHDSNGSKSAFGTDFLLVCSGNMMGRRDNRNNAEDAPGKQAASDDGIPSLPLPFVSLDKVCEHR